MSKQTRSIILALLAFGATACLPAKRVVSRDDPALTERAGIMLLAGVRLTAEVVTKNFAGHVVQVASVRDASSTER